jgi:intracellular septation protein A
MAMGNVRWVKGNWEKKQGNIWYQLNLRQGFFFQFCEVAEVAIIYKMI